MKINLSLTPEDSWRQKFGKGAGFAFDGFLFGKPAIPSSGSYVVEIEASASRAGKGFAEMGVSIGESFQNDRSEGRIPFLRGLPV